MVEQEWVSSGNSGLDQALQGLRLGDNVVWQVTDLSDYRRFTQDLVRRALPDGRRIVYVRFAPHPPLFAEDEGLEIIRVDPAAGFDVFSAAIHRLIEERGPEVFYVFDNLSALVEPWATDELVGSFFQVTCPYLRELNTVAYFALSRGAHAYSMVARVAETTQVLLDVFWVAGVLYVHPVKAWRRYSPSMFLPHRVDTSEWAPILQVPAGERLASRPATGPAVAPTRTITSETAGSSAPWHSVYARLRHRGSGGHSERAALQAELRRMLMGDEPRFAALADQYLGVDDLLAIRERMIGSGRVGGKSAGMLLARAILLSQAGKDDQPDWRVILDSHDSYYIGSDVFFSYLVENGLFRRRLEVHRRPSVSHDEFAELQERFMAGAFAPAIMDRLREMLDHYGQTPIIVRSSSLFEDSFGHAFAGKYLSEFCANQGNREERLRDLTLALKRIYASALSPDALSYRRRHGLLAFDEQMAILVQRVTGSTYRQFYFPPLAGVGFSYNVYRWTDRIDPDRGLIRLVFGLGTRAVDRVDDYPRMIAASHPDLRPESGEEVARYAQHAIDLIDLQANAFTSLPVDRVLAGLDYPDLHLYVSQMADGYAFDPTTSLLEGHSNRLVLTFNNLLRRTNLVPLLSEMLHRLESAYERPVDVEFSARLEADRQVRLSLLQCRPMTLPGQERHAMPEYIPPDSMLFRTDRMAGGGVVSGIRYIVHIDPVRYAALDAGSLRSGLGRLVGRLNSHPLLAGSQVMMMGPGRWGSSNIELGVNVTYADIDNTAVLVEVAREQAGQLPEVSFGTHFFQDLVEAQIIYLPVYPDDPQTAFNAGFFEGAANALCDLLPNAEAYAGVVKVIDVALAAAGRLAQVVADPEGRQAVCYLAED